MPLNSPDPAASYAWMLTQLQHFHRIIGNGAGIDELIRLHIAIQGRLFKDGYTYTWNAFNMTYTVEKKGE